jgi:hypothetical protein
LSLSFDSLSEAPISAIAGGNDVVALLAVTLDGLGESSGGTVAVLGAVSATLGATTLIAFDDVLHGASSVTLASPIAALNGSVAISAALSSIFSAVAPVADGISQGQGSGAVVLAPLAATGSGGALVQGVATAGLAVAVGSGAAAAVVAGANVTALAPIGLSASGVNLAPRTGSLSLSFGTVALAGLGRFTVTGATASQALDLSGASASQSIIITGTNGAASSLWIGKSSAQDG